MLEKLACQLGRNDEEPNIALAEEICKIRDKVAIEELVGGLKGKDKAVANDCIKVLYEIGDRHPELIVPYGQAFIELLLSKNNRLAWGTMMALATIADLIPQVIYDNLEVLKQAYKVGSVITVDNSITVFAKLCQADKTYEEVVFPILIEHLASCRPKEVGQHAERMMLAIHAGNSEVFLTVLAERETDLSEPQLKRINKLRKQLLTTIHV